MEDDLSGTETNGTTGGEDPDQSEARMVRLEALQEERQRRQGLAKELEQLKAAQAERERAEAEQKGEFQRLYTEANEKLTSTQTELEQLRAERQERLERVAARNTTRAEALPESIRGLMPSNADPDTLAGWLDRAEATVTQPKFAAGTQSQGGGPEPIPDECRAEAEKYGKDPRWWHEKVWKKRKKSTTK